MAATDVKLKIVATNATNRAFKSASNNFTKLSGQMKALKNVALGLSGAAAGLGFAFVKAASSVDRIAKSSRDANVAVRTFREWEFAASQAGVSTEQFEAGLGRANRRIGLFLQDGAGPAAKAFKTLGIGVRDLNGEFVGNEAVIRQFVSKLEQVESQAERTAIVTGLFGDDARRLNLVFGQGAGSLATYAKEFERLGLAYDEGTVQKAEDFTDATDKLARVFDRGLVEIMGAMAPAVNDIARSITNALPGIREFAKGLNGFFGGGGTGRADVLKRDIAAIETTIGRLQNQIKRNEGGITGAIFGGNAKAAELREQALQLTGRLVKLRMELYEVRKAAQATGETDAPAQVVNLASTEADALATANVYANQLYSQLGVAYANAAKVAPRSDPNNLGEAYKAALDAIPAQEYAAKLASGLQTEGQQISGVLSQVLQNGAAQGGKGMAQTLLQALQNNFANQAADLLASVFSGAGGTGGGGFLGGVAKIFGFAEGGIVPGPQGSARLVLAHGGEGIYPPGKGPNGGGGMNITVNAPNAAPGMEEKIALAVQQAVSLARRDRIDANSRGRP